MVVALVVTAHTAWAGINVWTGGGRPSRAFSNLVIAPGEPTTLYASTFTAEDGWVYKSTDGGSTWDQILDVGNPAFVMAAYPSRPNSVYIVVGAYGSGSQQTDTHVLRSIDGGATWDQADTGLHRGSNTVTNVGVLAIDPFAPSTLYAGTDLGVFKSTDQASTWSALTTGLPSDRNFDTFVYQLVIDPVTSTTLYARYIDFTTSSGGVFKSTDGGATWSAADSGLPTDAYINALAIDPRTPSTLYLGTNVVMFGTNPGVFETSPGVFKSTDGGATWSPGYATGLPATSCIAALFVDPHTSTTLYAAVQYPGGVFQSDDAGANWRPLDTGEKFDGAWALAIDPVGPTTIYALTNAGVFSIQEVAAVCTGDCSSVHVVAITDVITLVNIALGTAEPAACAGGGLPLGGEVDVAVIIEAVNNALGGCGH